MFRDLSLGAKQRREVDTGLEVSTSGVGCRPQAADRCSLSLANRFSPDQTWRRDRDDGQPESVQLASRSSLTSCLGKGFHKKRNPFREVFYLAPTRNRKVRRQRWTLPPGRLATDAPTSWPLPFLLGKAQEEGSGEEPIPGSSRHNSFPIPFFFSFERRKRRDCGKTLCPWWNTLRPDERKEKQTSGQEMFSPGETDPFRFPLFPFYLKRKRESRSVSQPPGDVNDVHMRLRLAAATSGGEIISKGKGKLSPETGSNRRWSSLLPVSPSRPFLFPSPTGDRKKEDVKEPVGRRMDWFSISCCFHRLKRCPKVRSTDACGQIDPLFWTSSFSSKRIRSSLEEGTRRMSSETRERIVSDDSCLVPSFFSKEKRKRKHNRSKIKIDCVMFLPDAPLNGRLEETSHRLSGRWQSFPLLND